MTTIAFIRHGETDWNIEKRAQGCKDIPLNGNGIKQANRLAERLRGQKWDVIYASPLSRAFETAKAISRVTGLHITSDERLREISFGETEGTTETERIERWGEEWMNLELGRETDEEADLRWKSALQEIVQNHKDQKVLIVTHGALLVRIYKELLQDKTDRWYGLNNTSFSIFQLTAENNWTCELFNCQKHLEETATI
ncbi:histidine phosphatase family protein [Fictibacillus barbaricus]|uniref:Histidine phosphatase family protein n=1 Tax=Fictibacillus barbaricus TaxID=182136 RepID=A0ABS2ZIA6_9BACL|nr:histidine phosphatase family protein [Fictibacillus barbaricus]MBN3547407.1 histidine phosphatase family protein [Fictibacillus barbaricus]GGB48763.1 phosphoglycerate mutase [Fictibacillus barbaricus]